MTEKIRRSLLEEMQKYPCVSGLEGDLRPCIERLTGIKLERDQAGNLFAFRKGSGKSKRNILFEAHFDEIGFAASEITKDGFIGLQTVGGMQSGQLPGTKVTVFGKKTFSAVIGSRPPHLSSIKSDKKDHETIYATAGFADDNEAGNWVRLGDPVHLFGPVKSMAYGRIVSRGLDNKVSVLAVLDAYSRLNEPYHDVTVLLSVGEETTGRGAHIFTNDRIFDMALVVDAGFGKSEGIDPTHTIDLGDGPSVSITEREHVGIARRVLKIAEKNTLPCQVIAEPGGTGTDSATIQIRHGGIPTAVISVPILNMHTASEVVVDKDIERTADLLTAVAMDPDIPEGKAVRYV